VLDGRLEIIDEVKQTDPQLFTELSERFSKLLQNSKFTDAIAGHMPTDETSQARVPIILKRIREITDAKARKHEE